MVHQLYLIFISFDEVVKLQKINDKLCQERAFSNFHVQII